jgi:dolichol-phosphate mannosyltransferase
VLRADVARELLIYGGLHRFVPILAHNQGFQVREILLRQHQEDTATRYYGVALYVKRLLDILTVYFVTKFTRRPIRFFGSLGLALALPGLLLTAYLGVYRLLGLGSIADRPLLLLAVLLMVVGFQSLSLGLIGEVIIFTHARQLSQYRVAEVIRAARLGPSPDSVPDAGASSSEPAAAESLPLPGVTRFQPRSS